MKVDLFAFQRTAVDTLRAKVAEAIVDYRGSHTPQVISFTAPTGAGKTIIMTALIESIFFGDDRYHEQNDAVIIWLSDSPQLNAQSRDKVSLKSEKIRYDDCIIVAEDSFDAELFEDGKIYFINTQKLGANSKLVRQGDDRTYTIWETLANTIEKKSDRLYFIIDEAHRGAQGAEAGRATTIMQKFIMGSPDDGLPPMPVVVGMSATPERFNRLVGNTTSTTRKCIVSAEDVRVSGLLKERIVINYPAPDAVDRDMGVLQAAAADWREKWDHWFRYCKKQHYTHVYPILVVQVLNGSGERLSETDLDDCLQKIQEQSDFNFKPGEVVHTFGQTASSITVNGLEVQYMEPSRISDDRNVRVVFFKDNLSTGWDCPRAETMMSFRRATDATYIAQLLGRMVRTPMQMHIKVDDVLNDVHLYLPHFDENTVYSIVEELQSAEGGQIPTFVDSEQIGKGKYDTLTIRPKRDLAAMTQQSSHSPAVHPPKKSADVDLPSLQTKKPSAGAIVLTSNEKPTAADSVDDAPHQESERNDNSVNVKMEEKLAESVQTVPQEESQERAADTFDREAVMRFINDTSFITYEVRKVRISDYLESLFRMTHLLTDHEFYPDAVGDVNGEIVEMIRDHIDKLKAQSRYDDVTDQVRKFKISSRVFDVFGVAEALQDVQMSTFTAADTDIDRQFRLADRKLKREGLGNVYGNKYGDISDPNTYKVEFISFTEDDECINALHRYAERKFHELHNRYRRLISKSDDESVRYAYDKIVSDGDVVSKHSFRLPETIKVPHDDGGKEFGDHLFVDENTGTAKLKLNSWEAALIEEEEKRSDFVCWIRNPSRSSWGLRIPYKMDNEIKPAYPDFIIIRKDEDGDYIFDILEPHNPELKDNLGKAQGMAMYAQENPEVGRVQLIRMDQDAAKKHRLLRLDMSRMEVREKVIKSYKNDELDHLFAEYGFYDHN